MTALAALPDVATAIRLLVRAPAGARRPDHRLRADVRVFARAVAQAPSGAAGPVSRPSVVRAAAGRRQRDRLAARGAARTRARARRSNRASCRTRRSRSRASRRARCGRCARTSRKRSAATAPTSSTTSRCRSPSIARFLDEARAALEAALPGVRFVTFGHLGDGNLHYNLAAPEGVAPDAFLAHTARANRIVHDLVAAPWRQHQRRARHRPAEARRARPLQERRRARPDAHGQGRARPGGPPQSRQDLPADAMTKILLWIGVVFVRAARAAAAQPRQGEAARRREPGHAAAAARRDDGPLRPLRRVPAAEGRRRRDRPGPTCGEPACLQRR